jgi:hypothetical protein
MKLRKQLRGVSAEHLLEVGVGRVEAPARVAAFAHSLPELVHLVDQVRQEGILL